MNHSRSQTTGKSHNKKSFTYKSGERGVGGFQSGQSSLKNKESRKLTNFFKKNVSEPVQKNQRTTKFSPEEIQNKV